MARWFILLIALLVAGTSGAWVRGVAPGTTFDPAHKTSTVDLTNGNLTATANSSDDVPTVRSTMGIADGGHGSVQFNLIVGVGTTPSLGQRQYLWQVSEVGRIMPPSTWQP